MLDTQQQILYIGVQPSKARVATDKGGRKSMNTTAIAQHLTIAETAIIEVQEWAKVLWVRFKGGCRFVSKKVGAMVKKAGMPAILKKNCSADQVALLKPIANNQYTYATDGRAMVRLVGGNPEYANNEALISSLERLLAPPVVTELGLCKLADLDLPKYPAELLKRFPGEWNVGVTAFGTLKLSRADGAVALIAPKVWG